MNGLWLCCPHRPEMHGPEASGCVECPCMRITPSHDAGAVCAALIASEHQQTMLDALTADGTLRVQRDSGHIREIDGRRFLTQIYGTKESPTNVKKYVTGWIDDQP